MHQPTLRVLKVLEAVAESDQGKRLSEFSQMLEIPKSTLVPILQTLCDRRYLSCDGNGLYQAGTALFSLGAGFSGCFPILSYVERQLRELVDIWKETCYFGVLEDGYAIYLCKQDSPSALRMLTAIGHRVPAYATGIGKALLSGCSREELQRMYPDGLQPITAHTITSFDDLERQLQQAKVDGYTWELEESNEFIRCFAVPVFKHGKIVAAISMAIPSFRHDPQRQDEIVAQLQRTSSRIGMTMEQTDAHFGSIF